MEPFYLDKFEEIVNERKFELFEEIFKKSRVRFVALFREKLFTLDG